MASERAARRWQQAIRAVRQRLAFSTTDRGAVLPAEVLDVISAFTAHSEQVRDRWRQLRPGGFVRSWAISPRVSLFGALYDNQYVIDFRRSLVMARASVQRPFGLESIMRRTSTVTLVDLTAEDPFVHRHMERSDAMVWSTTKAGIQYYDLPYQRLRQEAAELGRRLATRGNV